MYSPSLMAMHKWMNAIEVEILSLRTEEFMNGGVCSDIQVEG
jgi:hypothetical protein